MSATRIQVVLDPAERERFRRHAVAEGLSLSAWMKTAARERIEQQERRDRLDTIGELQSFFAEGDARELGREPDWEDHLRVIGRSRGSGAADS